MRRSRRPMYIGSPSQQPTPGLSTLLIPREGSNSLSSFPFPPPHWSTSFLADGLLEWKPHSSSSYVDTWRESHPPTSGRHDFYRLPPCFGPIRCELGELWPGIPYITLLLQKFRFFIFRTLLAKGKGLPNFCISLSYSFFHLSQFYSFFLLSEGNFYFLRLDWDYWNLTI